METKDFINIMKDLIDSYEFSKNENSPSNQEIMMWRIKYIEDQNIKDEFDKRNLLFMPSESLLRYMERIKTSEIITGK